MKTILNRNANEKTNPQQTTHNIQHTTQTEIENVPQPAGEHKEN